MLLEGPLTEDAYAGHRNLLGAIENFETYFRMLKNQVPDRSEFDALMKPILRYPQVIAVDLPLVAKPTPKRGPRSRPRPRVALQRLRELAESL